MSRSTTRIQVLSLVDTLKDGDIIPTGPASGDVAKGITFLNLKNLIIPGNNIRTVTANTTALLTDGMILVDATTGPITVSLPAASEAFEQEFTVKKIDATLSSMILDPDGSETIDGNTTITTTTQYTSFTIKSDGVTWWIK